MDYFLMVGGNFKNAYIDLNEKRPGYECKLISKAYEVCEAKAIDANWPIIGPLDKLQNAKLESGLPIKEFRSNYSITSRKFEVTMVLEDVSFLQMAEVYLKSYISKLPTIPLESISLNYLDNYTIIATGFKP
jgi:hypothetical protein